MRSFLALLCWLGLPTCAVLAADPPKRDWEAVELVGQATDYWFKRDWRTYYWREDFSFILNEDGGKSWRIISREPTPAYTWRLGTTFTALKVDWTAKPRVKVVGVKAVDRIPADFHDFKLNEPNLATALLIFVETKPNEWQEWFVNNWFHPWGEKADQTMHRWYADKPAPYNIYGFARGQSAPFDKKGKEILEKHKDNPSLMFQGRVRTAQGTPFGYELELLDLIGRNVQTGGSVLLYGDAKTIPLLDSRKPEK